MTMVDDALASEDLVLVLAADDSWMFVGTVTEVLEHADRHRRTGHAPQDLARPTPRSLDFHDAAGHRLHPLVDERLEVHGFAVADTPADPVTTRQRIDRVLETARAHLAAHPPGAQTHYPVGTEVPEVTGDLSEVLDQLRVAEQIPDNAHKRGWFHNLLHAMG